MAHPYIIYTSTGRGIIDLGDFAYGCISEYGQGGEGLDKMYVHKISL